MATFGNVCLNAIGGPNSFTVNGTTLTNADIIVGPLAGFTFSTTTVVQSYNGIIPVTGAGAAATGVATNATVLNPNTVTLDASVSSIGCSPVISNGFEYCSISGLLNGLVQRDTYYYKAYAVNNGGIAYGA